MSLSRIVRESTGINLHKCHACGECDLAAIPHDAQDVSLSALIQMIIMDDDEALTTRLLWSDAALEAARHACKRGIDLHAVLLALRQETARREQK